VLGRAPPLRELALKQPRGRAPRAAPGRATHRRNQDRLVLAAGPLDRFSERAVRRVARTVTLAALNPRPEGGWCDTHRFSGGVNAHASAKQRD
jgi:hypothetical protein